MAKRNDSDLDEFVRSITDTEMLEDAASEIERSKELRQRLEMAYGSGECDE